MAIRKALLVGIDDYPRSPLNSCIADVKEMSERIRTQYGFTDIQTLTDREATLANVQAALQKLLSDVKPEDRVFFFYSGHGHQIRIGDDLEEVLVLYDEFLRDDALSAMTQHIPEGTLTIALDSCFSGGMDKVLVPTADGVEVALVKKWTSDAAPSAVKALLESIPAAKELELAQGAPRTGVTYTYRPFGAAPIKSYVKAFGVESIEPSTKADKPSEVGQAVVNAVLLTASSENETASAKTSKSKGLSAFTYAVCEVLNRLGPNVPPSTLIAEATTQIRQIGVRQTPLLRARQAAVADTRSFILLESTSGSATRAKVEEIMAHEASESKAMPETGAQPPAAVGQDIEQKFIGALLGGLVRAAPAIISAFTKEYSPEKDAAPHPDPMVEQQKWLPLAIAALSAVPSVIRAFRKEYAPEKALTEEAEEKGWLDVARVFGPRVIAAIPDVVRELRKDFVAEKAESPEMQQKFLGAILRVLGPVIVQAAPTILGSLRKGMEPEAAAGEAKGIAAEAIAPDVQEQIRFRRNLARLLRNQAQLSLLTQMLRKELGAEKALVAEEAAEELMAEVASELAPAAATKDLELTEEEQQKFLGGLVGRVAMAGARWAFRRLRR